MQDFRKLEIYKEAIKYCAEIYQFCSKLPEEEKYGLISQIKRAATSIALNIAEGTGCNSNSEFSVFIRYSLRSSNDELDLRSIVVRIIIIN